MKTIFTLIIGLMISFVSFGQQSCNAYFTYTVDTNAMTVQFTDQSFEGQNVQATSWNWQINGASYTDQNLTFTYTSLPFTACLTASFDSGCESTFCDSIYVEVSDPCANFSVDAGFGLTDIGTCEGEISVDVYNGTAPYTYDWGSYGSTATISDLCEGSYPVVVTDANGCSASSTGYVAEEDTSSNQQIIDSLSNAALDTCINFTVVDVYVSNIVMLGSTSFQVEWTFIDDQQVSHIFYETYDFGGQYGNYYVEISVDCGNKSVQTWGDVITIDENTTEINKIENVNNVSLYPNPVKETATIEFNLTQNSNVTISIIDYTGKVINTTSVNSYQGNNTVTLSTNELNSGIYFARIVSNKSTKTIKFVK